MNRWRVDCSGDGVTGQIRCPCSPIYLLAWPCMVAAMRHPCVVAAMRGPGAAVQGASGWRHPGGQHHGGGAMRPRASGNALAIINVTGSIPSARNHHQCHRSLSPDPPLPFPDVGGGLMADVRMVGVAAALCSGVDGSRDTVTACASYGGMSSHLLLGCAST